MKLEAVNEVGNEVKLLVDYYDFKKGDKGVIKGIDTDCGSDDMDLLVEFTNETKTSQLWINNKKVELVTVVEDIKVGDKVRVKEGLKSGNHYDELYFNETMEKACGREFEVTGTCGDNFTISFDKYYVFNHAILEKVEQDDRIIVSEKLFYILEEEQSGCQYQWLKDVMYEIGYDDLEDEMPSITEIAAAIEKGYKLEGSKEAVKAGDVIKFQTDSGKTKVRVVKGLEDKKIRFTNGLFIYKTAQFEIIAKAEHTEI